jgi:hypothetical protein
MTYHTIQLFVHSREEGGMRAIQYSRGGKENGGGGEGCHDIQYHMVQYYARKHIVLLCSRHDRMLMITIKRTTNCSEERDLHVEVTEDPIEQPYAQTDRQTDGQTDRQT